MAIGLRLKFDGWNAGAVRRGQRRDGRSTQNPPEGLLFHSAGPIDDGWGVIDFWESREALRPLPAGAARAGDPGSSATRRPPARPSIKEFPVHHFLKGS